MCAFSFLEYVFIKQITLFTLFIFTFVHADDLHSACVQGLADIATNVASLAAKAREGKLKPQEFQVIL